MMLVADIVVRSTKFKVGGRWFISRRVPDENLFHDKVVILARAAGEGWRLRYVLGDEDWGEGRGRPVKEDHQGRYMPLTSRKGFKARLYLDVSPWE